MKIARDLHLSDLSPTHGSFIAMTSTEPLIRISICIHRRAGISEEAFHQYWAHEHGPLAAEWLKRCGGVKYVQVRKTICQVEQDSNPDEMLKYHTSSEHRNLAKKMADAVGRPVMDWDGIADFYVRKYEDFEDAFLDSEYQERIRPDELKLIDMDTVRMTVGVDYVCINEGEIVESEEPTCKTVYEPVAMRATIVVEVPDPIVTDSPGVRVFPSITKTGLVVPSAAGSIVEAELPTCRTVYAPVVTRATTVVEEPDPRVTEEPGVIVLPSITKAEPVVEPAAAGAIVETELPTCSIVYEPLVTSAAIVVEAPDPSVTDDPGVRVFPSMTTPELVVPSAAD